MAYNSFRLQILLRLGFITALIGIMLFLVIYPHWYISGFILLLVTGAFIYDLLGYLEKTNRELARFFASVRYSDFTQRFDAGNKKDMFADIYSEVNNILQTFQQIKADKEANHLYLQNLVMHLRIGIITLDENGKVSLMNQAAKDLLQLPHLIHIQGLNQLSPELVTTINTLENEENRLVSLPLKNGQLLLMVKTSTFRLQDQWLKIVSLQNIRSEMEEQELDAWQKLIRVLAHEIMNSITPVISLTSSIYTLVDSELIQSGTDANVDEETLQDIRTGLQTIEKRSQSLLQFVEKYRQLTRIPKPNLQRQDLRLLLQRLHHLLISDYAAHRVGFNLQLPSENLEAEIDSNMIEQVIINLLKNALEACAEVPEPRVEVVAYRNGKDNKQIKIEVRDNGPGIAPEIMDQIFIPFYTTKKQGSGIGLSLSRQIMRLHKGRIQAGTTNTGQTVFTLTFSH